MMNEQTLILVLFSGIVVLAGKIIFDWLSHRQVATEGATRIHMKCPLDKAEAISDIKWLKKVHDQTDSDGKLIWYFPTRLVTAMEKVAEQTTQQNMTLLTIANCLESNGDKLDTIVQNGKGK